jgi:multicomponent Na+:H+ antiporter subunit E
MMHYVRTMILSLIVYLALTASLELGNVVLGVLVATLAAVLLRPARQPPGLRQLPGALLALVKYTVVMLWELIVSGLQVAHIVLSPSLPIKPGIIAIPSGTDSDLATALSAHSITVTPGELVVEISDDGVMYTHVLDVTMSEAARLNAQEQRRNLLSKILK